jgi:tRNA-specific 2-thiouridylase
MVKKAMVAMSGGVDSSVAAYLLRDAGYSVTGVTMCLGIREDGQQARCCGRDAIEDARRVCERLRIPHHVIDFSADLQQKVIDKFVREYRRGRTPNPCIDCNRYLKFGRLLELARSMGFDFIATGHYAKIEKKGNLYQLLKPKDRIKDQTYFLYPIQRENLASILFPLQDMTKDEVRTLARRARLPVAEKLESQDICFVTQKDYRLFFRQMGVPAEPGEIVHRDGRALGEHRGIVYYTVGQRTGLGVSAEKPLYVLSIDPRTNRIVVGAKEDLYATGLIAGDFNLLADRLPEAAEATVRYRKKSSLCHVAQKGGRVTVTFSVPQESITPGQAVVLYGEDEIMGGGVIDEVMHGTSG